MSLSVSLATNFLYCLGYVKIQMTKKTIATIIQYILGWLNIPVPVK